MLECWERIRDQKSEIGGREKTEDNNAGINTNKNICWHTGMMKTEVTPVPFPEATPVPFPEATGQWGRHDRRGKLRYDRRGRL
jgi:hypothetical protein